MTTLLLDADVIAFQSAIFNEVATEVEPGYWTWHCEFHKVISSIHWYIDTYMKRLKADNYVLCLTDTNNFRKDILSTYKGNRSNLKKPLVLKPTREYLISELSARIIPNLEGDDLLGLYQTDPNKTDETIIVSIDKDLKTVRGPFYNPNTDIVLNITQEEADYYHFYQTLIGDTIDGYRGLEGYGPVTAKKLLDSKGATWSTIVEAYEKKGLTEEDALVQARCAKILTHEWFNHETGPILWTP